MQSSPKEGLGSGEFPKDWSVSYVLPETSRHTNNAHPTTARLSPEDQGYALDLLEFSEHESEDSPHPASRISMITEGDVEIVKVELEALRHFRDDVGQHVQEIREW